jgi:hypothetical protein
LRPPASPANFVLTLTKATRGRHSCTSARTFVVVGRAARYRVAVPVGGSALVTSRRSAVAIAAQHGCHRVRSSSVALPDRPCSPITK